MESGEINNPKAWEKVLPQLVGRNVFANIDLCGDVSLMGVMVKTTKRMFTQDARFERGEL